MKGNMQVTISWPVWRTIIRLLPILEGQLKSLEQLLQLLATLLSSHQASQEPGPED